MRTIICQGHTYVTESQNTIESGSWSLITEIDKDLPFDDWWNDPDCLDIVNDWDEIKSIQEKLSTKLNSAKCSDCGIDCKVPFIPDGIRPVYCKSCFNLHKNN